MKIKKSIVVALAKMLSGIKLNKLSDKAVKVAFIKNHLALRKASLSIQDDQDELVRKFQEDWKDELFEVVELRKENKPVEGHEEFLKAEAEANATLFELFDSEVDVDIVPVKINDFAASFDEDELTLDNVALLAESGLLE